MRAVFGLVLLIGMGLAGFAVYTVNGYFAEQEARILQERQRASAAISTVDVYAPTRAITYGELIRPEDVTLIKYAEDFLPEGVFQTEEELFPEGLNVFRVATRPIEINEPLMAVKVTEPGAPRGITALLEEGMRAWPLSNQMTAAFAGDLRISDLIDLYWVGNVNGGRESRLVKSRLEIIAMDEPDANGNGGGTGVVVQVTQQDFADLQVLAQAGTLSLTPVGSSDAGETVAIERDLNEVLGVVIEAEPEPEAAPEVEEKCFVTQRVGGQSQQVEVRCPD